jgi:hypothetical protein
MERNMSNTDRSIRIALGLVIIGIAGWLGSWWGLVGVVLVGTGLIRWCPIYKLLGISTLRARERV